MEFNSEQLVELKVTGISGYPNPRNCYTMTLTEVGGDRRIQIVIGGAEAQSIECVLRKISTPRPLTHDIMYRMMELYGIRIEGIVIGMLPDGVFTGTILLGPDDEGNTRMIDARSSDAVALAVRTNSPLYIAPSLLDRIGVRTSETSPFEEIEAAKESSLAMMTTVQLQKKLEEAISDERYEEASLIKAEMNRRSLNSQTSNP